MYSKNDINYIKVSFHPLEVVSRNRALWRQVDEKY